MFIILGTGLLAAISYTLGLKKKLKDTYKKSEVQAMISAYEDAINKGKAATESLQNVVTSNKSLDGAMDRVIAGAEKAIETLAKLTITQRLDFMRIHNPGLQVSDDILYMVDDIHNNYVSGTLDIGEYMLQVHVLLDSIFPNDQLNSNSQLY